MTDQEKEFSLKYYFIPLTSIKAIQIIVIIGLMLYASSLLNGFVGDDNSQIVDNPSIQSVQNIPSLFMTGTFNQQNGQAISYYKPLASLSYAIMYIFFNDSAFGYHFVQILLHITNAVLLFIFFRYFFKNGYAFLLSMLFLIHPINTETVVYISDLQDILFVFFGLLAFVLSMKVDKSHIHVLVPLLLLCSLLSKESGIVFLFIIPLYFFLFRKVHFLRSILQSILVLLVYLLIRIGLAHIYFNNTVSIAAIQALPFSHRLLNMPEIIFYYLKTFIYPDNLSIFQSWIVKRINLLDFYLPLFFDTCFLVMVGISVVWIFKNAKKSFKNYLFFTSWFAIGIALSIQIIPLDDTVADRWFYFPIIGLLGMIGVLLNCLPIKKIFWRRVLLIGCIIISICFVCRTLIRVADWKNNETLLTHDMRTNNNSSQLDLAVAINDASIGKISASRFYLIRSTKLFPDPIAYADLATLYIDTNDPRDAIVALDEAIKYRQNDAVLWGNLALATYQVGNKKEALTEAEHALTLSQNDANIEAIIKNIKEGKPLIVQ